MYVADEGGGSGTVMRVYRKGNWTVSETMVLIEAKQMDDERRMKRSSTTATTTSEISESSRGNKPAELRWKCVEDYCWRKGCFRSQNQCNDKWDNLMRHYKKIRDYERKSSSLDHLSYWKTEKNERKEKDLPTNMLLQIYEALVEVVDKKGSGQRVIAGAGSGSAAISVLPLPQAQPPPLQPSPPYLQSASPTVDSDTSEYSADSPAKRRRRGSSNSDTSEYSADSPAKRRKRQGGGGGNVGDQQGTSSASASQELGTAILKSASIIAEALQACEQREETRYRDLVSLHEKRLKIEESKSEINRQGIIGLVDAINKLANCILALASNYKNQQSAPK